MQAESSQLFFHLLPISSFLHSLQCSNTELSNIREKHSRSNLSAGTLFIPYFLIYQTNKRCKSGFGIFDQCKQKSPHFNNQSARICIFPEKQLTSNNKILNTTFGTIAPAGGSIEGKCKMSAKLEDSGSFGGPSRRRMQTLN